MAYDIDAVRDTTGRVLDGAEKHIAILERRVQFLVRRIKRVERDQHSALHDRQELEAINWALGELYEIVDHAKDDEE